MKAMDEMIAYCGLICTECTAYLATQKDDDSERQKVAEDWSKLFNTKIEPQDISCDGCLSEGGRLYKHCITCPIRNCGLERGVKNCAYCDDYACQKLIEWFSSVPSAKITLDKIREGL